MDRTLKLPNTLTDLMIFGMSKLFIGQDNLSHQIMELHVTPSMMACYWATLKKRRKRNRELKISVDYTTLFAYFILILFFLFLYAY